MLIKNNEIIGQPDLIEQVETHNVIRVISEVQEVLPIRLVTLKKPIKKDQEDKEEKDIIKPNQEENPCGASSTNSKNCY